MIVLHRSTMVLRWSLINVNQYITDLKGNKCQFNLSL